MRRMIERTCARCGAGFQVTSATRRKYCTDECRHNAVSDSVKRRWQDEKGRAVYSDAMRKRSESDQWRNAEHFQSGEKHPRYKGQRREREQAMHRYEYKKWRTDVFKRDAYTCQDCGTRGGRLVAHHIQRWADKPELRYEVSNGITLCEKCHDKRHGMERRPKTYKCEACGELKKDGRGKYCSACRSQWSKNGSMYRCAQCGKEHYRSPSQVREGLMFCGWGCYAAHKAGS